METRLKTMPGAWEIAPSVLAYTIHTDTTTVAWAYGLRNLIIPNGECLGLAGMPFDHARNTACQHVLERGFEWAFSLDSDVIAPRDAVIRLLAHNQPIISGLYNRRSPPHAIPVMIKDGQWVVNFPRGHVIEVDLVGAGCLLIHRSVLERFLTKPGRPGKPWFDWRVDLKGHAPGHECLSEDFSFCWRAKSEFGYKILVDSSVECRHVGLAEATYGAFGPLNCSPVT